MELTIDTEDQRLPATLTLPARPIQAALITLHGAAAGHRSFFLYEHLARVLPMHGVAVLRYDRRADPEGHDIPLRTQVRDAHTAMKVLRQHVGQSPIGLWGFSQGGWVARFAAATHPAEVAFLITVSASGVSPAAQMRYGTAEQLRRHGYSTTDIQQLTNMRIAVEDYIRGVGDRATAQELVDMAASRPWFPLASVRRDLPQRPHTWQDMDFEPEPVFAKVACPVLAFYGETDEWVPIEESIAAWQRAFTAASNQDLTVHRLQGCDHTPTIGHRNDIDGISDDYTKTLTAWIEGHKQASELEINPNS